MPIVVLQRSENNFQEKPEEIKQVKNVRDLIFNLQNSQAEPLIQAKDEPVFTNLLLENTSSPASNLKRLIPMASKKNQINRKKTSRYLEDLTNKGD